MTLYVFQADTEPIWWSWVRAIATELVLQTPFRAQRCLNFLGILTTCPRGPVPLPDSPTDQRRRSRSELRCWPTTDLTIEKISDSVRAASILEESRRRAHSELRGWSSSNSSDDDILSNNSRVSILINAKNRTNGILMQTRAWGCSESSEGSDDSLTWGTGPQHCTTIINSVDCVDAAITISEPTTREQRMQKYKEARRRENEARRRQVMEEDARRRKASKVAEENNNDIIHRCLKIREKLIVNDNDSFSSRKKVLYPLSRLSTSTEFENTTQTVKKSPQIIKKPLNDFQNTVRFEDIRHTSDDNRNNNCNNIKNIQLNLSNVTAKPGILRTSDSNERRSRARERRSVRERNTLVPLPSIITNNNTNEKSIKSFDNLKERLCSSTPIKAISRTRFPEISPDCIDKSTRSALSAMSTSLSITTSRETSREEEVAKLLERCQRVDRYVPVREKLTLFESLSRMGGRLARSTEDLGRSSSNNLSPKGKQRARSLHDLNRGGAKSLPVREMCRFFENEKPETTVQRKKETTRSRLAESSLLSPTYNACRKESSPKNPNAPCIRTSTRRKHYAK